MRSDGELYTMAQKVVDSPDGLAVLYMWIKQNHVSKKEFIEILKVVDRFKPINTKDDGSLDVPW